MIIPFNRFPGAPKPGIYFLLAISAFSGMAKCATGHAERVQFCALRNNSRKYAGKLVRVRGWIYIDFEHYSLNGTCPGGINLDESDGEEGARRNGFVTQRDTTYQQMRKLVDETWPYSAPPNTICRDCGIKKYKVYVTILGLFRTEPVWNSSGTKISSRRLVLVIKSLSNLKTKLQPDRGRIDLAK